MIEDFVRRVVLHFLVGDLLVAVDRQVVLVAANLSDRDAERFRVAVGERIFDF